MQKFISALGIHGRQLKVMGYCDEFTRKKFEGTKSKTFAMIKPDCYNHMGKIIDIIQSSSGLTISRLKMLKMTRSLAEEQYAEHKGEMVFRISHETNSNDRWYTFLPGGEICCS